MARRVDAPTPLRCPPWILAEWANRVQVAHNFATRGIPTVLVDIRVVTGIGQELELLRASNQFLRGLRAEPRADEGEET